MRDPLDQLFDETPEEDVTPEETPEDEAPEPEPTAGAVEAEPAQPSEGKGEKTDEPPASTEEKAPQMIPIAAHLDEREKRQRAEQKLAELERWRAQIQAQQSQQKPDFFDNPEAVLQQQQRQFQEMLIQDRVQRSAAMVEQEHGKEFVQEVIDFFNNPKHMAKSHEFLSHPFPMQEAVKYYRQQQVLAEIGDDPTAYRERLKAEWLAEMQAQQPAPVQPQRPATPPRSMASAPAASGGKSVMPVDPLFD